MKQRPVSRKKLCSPVCDIHAVSGKNGATLLLPVTLPNDSQIAKFIYLL